MAGAFSKHRFQIWNSNQHPYKHNASEFIYVNEAVPGATTMKDVLDYILAVLYPLSQASVPTPADLPISANFTVAIGTPAVITTTGDTYYTGDQVKMATTGTLPIGLSTTHVYYLKETTAGVFELYSDKEFSTPVTVTSTGTGVQSIINLPNAYRVVLDDGDGKAASYRYEHREGDVVPVWYKVGDLDWGQDSVLAAFQNITQDLYVSKLGRDDTDATGAVLTGDQAGQHIYGGASANTNLILHANNGDGTGAQTGAIEVADPILPLTTDVSLGSLAKPFFEMYASETIVVGDLTMYSGTITDLSGAISLDGADLNTTGDIHADVVNGNTVSVGDLTITTSQITSSSSDISFGSNKIKTTGDIEGGNIIAKNGAKTTTITNGTTDTTITSSQGSISLQNANLKGVNALTTTSVGTGLLTVDNLTLDTNILSSTGDVNISPAVGSKVKLNKATDITGAMAATGAVSGLTVSDGHTTLDGSKITSSTGYVDVDTSKILRAGNIEGVDLKGTTLTAGIVSENISDIVDFPFTGASEGNTLYYNSGHWVAAAPTPGGVTDHGLLTGLADDDHTQYALLAGRTGGQNIIGGTAGTDTLTFKANTTTALEIKTKDTFAPFTDAIYSSGWTGLDLGTASLNFRDVYSKGEFKGFRVENVGILPSANVVNKGRLALLTTDNTIYYDTGGTWTAVGSGGGSSGTAYQDLSIATAGQTIINLSFPINTSTELALFYLFVNGSLLTYGASNDYTFNSSTQIQLNTPLVYGQNIQACKLMVVGGGSGGASKFVTSNLILANSDALVISTTYLFQTWRVQGASAAVTLSTTPFGSTAPTDGTQIIIIGNDDTNTVTFVANDAAKGILGYDVTVGKGQTVTYEYNAGLDRYVIVGTSN